MQTKIIELNGLPGSGKSTITNKMIEKLQTMNIKACNFFDLIDSKNKRDKIKLHIKGFSKTNIKFLFNLFRLSYLIKPVNIRKRIPQLKTAYMFFVYLTSLEEWAKEYDYVFLDQGIVQSISSIIHIDEINELIIANQLLKDVLQKKINTYIVNCKISINESKNRIEKRDLRQGRFDSIRGQELLDGLRIQNQYLNEIRKSAMKYCETCFIEINMDEDLEENTNTILEKIGVH